MGFRHPAKGIADNCRKQAFFSSGWLDSPNPGTYVLPSNPTLAAVANESTSRSFAPVALPPTLARGEPGPPGESQSPSVSLDFFDDINNDEHTAAG